MASASEKVPARKRSRSGSPTGATCAATGARTAARAATTPTRPRAQRHRAARESPRSAVSVAEAAVRDLGGGGV